MESQRVGYGLKTDQEQEKQKMDLMISIFKGSELQNDIGVDACWEAGDIVHMAENGFHSSSASNQLPGNVHQRVFSMSDA